MSRQLNPQQFRFVLAYVELEHAGKAAIAAGYSAKSASSVGPQLLHNPLVQEAIAEHRENIALQASITPAAVLKRWWEIANADPRELVESRQINCRHCHGVGHAYQWTEGEYVRAMSEAIDKGKPAPDGSGGFGFDVNAEPNPECPECGGHGSQQVLIKDTRKLKGAAKRLYAGIHQTRDGVKVLMRDQDKALENIAKFLGMFVERKEVSGPNGGPISTVKLSAEDLTDDQLAAIIKTSVSDDTESDSSGDGTTSKT